MPTISNSSSSSSMSVASATNGAILQLLLSALTGAARTNNPFEIPVYNDLAHQRFNVSLAIGTPPRAYNVLLDSGSTSAWVPIVNTTGCAPNCPWTYDPTSSSTISKTNETFLNLYGTGGEIRVEGSWYKDNVSVGGLPALRDAAFAIADFPKPFYDQGNRGILGMGCRFIEYGPDGPSPIPFAPLWQRISKAASSGRSKFAMWLNAPNAASGTIQFGSEDSSKHRGKLLSVRINEDAPGVISDWNITLTGVVRGRVGLQGRPKKQLITPTNYTLPVILDSGAPNLYIPTSLYTPIADGLNATENINGSPWVPCSLRKPETGFLEFQFATSNAGELVKIRVTYESIIYPPGFPVTVPPLPDQNGEKMCYLGIVPFDGFVRLLGAPFLRSAYTVFDLDNKEIRMAQARWKV